MQTGAEKVELELQTQTIPATILKKYSLPSTGVLWACNVEGYGYAEFVRLDNDYSTERRARSGMPASYAYKRSGDFGWNYYTEDTAKVKKLCRLFVQSYPEWKKQGRGLYIWSKTKGSGKTMLSCCLVNEIIDRYSEVVKFVNAADFVKMVVSKSEDKIKPLYDCSLLVFDDIGTEDNKKEWVVENVYRLVNYRYANNLTTIYTSNNPFTESHKDDRIHSRIFGASVELHLPNANIREALSVRSQKEFIKELEQTYGEG